MLPFLYTTIVFVASSWAISWRFGFYFSCGHAREKIMKKVIILNIKLLLASTHHHHHHEGLLFDGNCMLKKLIIKASS